MTLDEYFRQRVREIETAFGSRPLDQEALECFLSDRSKPDLPFSFEMGTADAVLIATMAGNFDQAVALVTGMPPEDRRCLVQAVNSNILPRHEREWTPHGITKTFRYWRETDKRDYLQFTNEIVDALADEFEVCLGYGTVLSIVRDRDLIKHDDDLDILVSVAKERFESYPAAMSSLVTHLEGRGFGIRGTYVSHRHVVNNRFCADVFLGLQEGERVSWHPGPRGVLLASEVFPPRRETLFGLTCLVPRETERYLEVVYGSDWRVPRPGWAHCSDPTPYADWFFKKKK